MKETIIEALAYPRSLVRGDMDLDGCQHAGNYLGNRRDCDQCDQGAECEWLYSNDEFVALASKPLEELEGALEFAIGYVDARVTRARHKPRKCQCEACTWLRRTRRLLDRVLAEAWNG